MKSVLRWTAISTLFLIPFLPLYVENHLFFPFITGKGFAFRILVEIATAAWAVLAIADRKYRPRFSWVLAIFAAFVLWMAVADFLAVNPHKAFWSNYERMDGWVMLIHAFMFSVVTGAFLSAEKLWKKWWLAFILAAALTCLYGVMQLLCAGQACGAGNAFFAIHQGGVRLDARMGNAAYLAAYLLFALAATAWQAIEAKGWLRYSLMALAALETFILLATATRGAILGMLGGAALASALWAFTAGRKGRQAGASVLVGLVVLAGGFWLARDTSFVRNEPTLTRIASISLSEGATRFTLWKLALEGVAERPITGWGQDGFNYVFNAKYQPALYAQEPWFDRAHNTFVDWLVAGGVPALLLFAALLIAAVAALLRAPSLSRAERILLVSALAAYAVQALVVFDNLFTYVPLAAILAIAHAASSRKVRAIESLPEPAASKIDALYAPAALVAALLLAWFVNVPSMAAASNLIYALSHPDAEKSLEYAKKAAEGGSFAQQEITEQLGAHLPSVMADATASDETKQAYAAFAFDRFNRELEEVPEDARFRVQYATALRAAGQYPAALEMSASALALSPKKQTIMIERGIEYWQAGDAKNARKAFDEAYALDTSFEELAAFAAAGAVIDGDLPASNQILLDAFGTTTVDRPVLYSAYYQAKRYPELVRVLALHVATEDSATARFQLATAYAIMGDYANGRRVVKEAVAKFPESAAQADALLAQFPPQYR